MTEVGGQRTEARSQRTDFGYRKLGGVSRVEQVGIGWNGFLSAAIERFTMFFIPLFP
jgi:hypothetical protein